MASRLPIKKDFVVPFLAGLVVAPFVKPVLRGTIKTAVGVTLRMRVLAAEATKEVQGMAAEVAAAGASTIPTAPPAAPGR